MAGGYKALTVPIAILQQKAFPRGHRLDKFVPLPNKEEVKKAKEESRKLFERQPNLRRWYYSNDGDEHVSCRACEKKIEGPQARATHTGCYPIISDVIALYREEMLCCICEDPLPNLHRAFAEFEGIPVCSPQCMDAWEWMTPMSWGDHLEAIIKKRAK